MPQENDPPIIVSGGSVTITFREQTFPPAAGGGFASDSRRITRVEVIVGGQPVLDESVKDGDATVRVHYE